MIYNRHICMFTYLPFADPNELKRAEWKFKIQMDFSLIEDKQDEFEM